MIVHGAGIGRAKRLVHGAGVGRAGGPLLNTKVYSATTTRARVTLISGNFLQHSGSSEKTDLFEQARVVALTF